MHPGGFPVPRTDVLGLRVEELLPFPSGETGTTASGGIGTVWPDDVHFTGAVAVDRLVDGRAAGQPAVTSHELGDGTAWYVMPTLDPMSHDALVDRVPAAAGVTATTLPDGLETVEQYATRATFRLVINHRERPVDLPSDIAGGSDLLGVLDEHGSVLVLPPGAATVLHRPHPVLLLPDPRDTLEPVGRGH